MGCRHLMGAAEYGPVRSLQAQSTHRRHHPFDIAFLLCFRYDMHIVFLPVSVMDDEKPLLHDLPDIQLGLSDDVHSSDFHKELLHMELSVHGRHTFYPLGTDCPVPPGALFREDELLSQMRELRRKAVLP